MLNENYKRILYIDLETQKLKIEKRKDLMDYLGGVGIAMKLCLKRTFTPNSPRYTKSSL